MTDPITEDQLRAVIREEVTAAVGQIADVINSGAPVEQLAAGIAGAVPALVDPAPVDVEAPLPHTAGVDCWCQPSVRDGRLRHHMTKPEVNQ